MDTKWADINSKSTISNINKWNSFFLYNISSNKCSYFELSIHQIVKEWDFQAKQSPFQKNKLDMDYFFAKYTPSGFV